MISSDFITLQLTEGHIQQPREIQLKHKKATTSFHRKSAPLQSQDNGEVALLEVISLVFEVLSMEQSEDLNNWY